MIDLQEKKYFGPTWKSNNLGEDTNQEVNGHKIDNLGKGLAITRYKY